MSGYAVRNDGQGWRAVNGPEDLLPDEWYTESNPPDPVPLPPTRDELISLSKAKRDALLSIAANRMGPLQDAVDLDEATVEEVAMLKKWKQYRIALNRIEQQPAFPDDIAWPVSPE
ncbi:tail fiber assembly protein [Pseudomonas gingeri NCPPB 3146 = LMG 5327]|uniref:Tail fiber assembly protein n=2 Tax=Pseudomonas gingeri TaxID=117681 RepID=A0A7Y8CEB3_9PSED|nr:tail fiber assembly protein [Pseudomonas gingeri]NWC14861.1 tail fiber assembly protein [Pseudomonas gingeri]PNQ91024.1 tail fiber assembly protein [Pseudomonas gingeri NCPPB 3146 = LMG 5327]